MRSPHRHSVWIDVFGVVLVGAVLLGGVVLLIGTGSSHFGLSEAAPGRSAGGSAIANGASARGPAPTARRGPTIGASRVPPGLSNPLSSGGGGASAPAPFPDGWREQAVPDLTGPSVGAPAAPVGGSKVGGSKVAGQEQGESSGPVLASRRSSRGSGASAAGRGSGGAAGRRAEAERFADQATALAGQLRQMSEPSGSEEEAAPSAEEAQTSSVGSRAKASGPGTPDDPNQVPIGDHLPWLAVVGVLWGAWRIGRGA